MSDIEEIQDETNTVGWNILIRHATLDDLPTLEWDGEFVHFRRLYAETFRRAELGEAILWVADLAEERVIGQVFVQLKSQRAELADGRTRAYVYGFRVRPAYRNAGIGTLMLQTLEEDLRRRGFRSVVLNVGKENMDARRLYERHGYQIIGTDPGRWSFIDDKGQRRDVVEPAWRLEKLLE